MARKNKNKKPEYVVICREFNRAAARIDITVIDKKQIETMSIKNNKRIVELGVVLDD